KVVGTGWSRSGRPVVAASSLTPIVAVGTNGWSIVIGLVEAKLTLVGAEVTATEDGEVALAGLYTVPVGGPAASSPKNTAATLYAWPGSWRRASVAVVTPVASVRPVGLPL